MSKNGRTDWQSLHKRLEQSRTATDTAFAPGAERVETAYRDRAARLARKVEVQTSEELPVMVFKAGAGRYGIELAKLAEVIPHAVCTPVPGGPPGLAGVLQVRGEIRPVWEISVLLGLPKADSSAFDSVVLVRAGRREFGLRVEGIEGVRVVKTEELGALPEASAHAKWITPDWITILDPGEFFHEEVR